MHTLETELRRFIVDNFLFGQDDDIIIDNDTSFIEAGILDSTGALELVQHIEETYGVRVEDHEFAPECLDSINRLARFIRRKHAVEGPSATARVS
jgi:acyl carrier protein